MKKTLSQITFDFAPADEKENTLQVSSPVMEEEKPVMPSRETIEAIKEPEQEVIKVPSGAKRGRKSLKEIATNADLINIP
jgi:hypothetical protein